MSDANNLSPPRGILRPSSARPPSAVAPRPGRTFPKPARRWAPPFERRGGRLTHSGTGQRPHSAVRIRPQSANPKFGSASAGRPGGVLSQDAEGASAIKLALRNIRQEAQHPASPQRPLQPCESGRQRPPLVSPAGPHALGVPEQEKWRAHIRPDSARRVPLPHLQPSERHSPGSPPRGQTPRPSTAGSSRARPRSPKKEVAAALTAMRRVEGAGVGAGDSGAWYRPGC